MALNFTIDDIPELEGKQEGDTVTLQVEKVNDDGTFDLMPVGGEQPPTDQSAQPPETAGSGEEAVKQALL